MGAALTTLFAFLTQLFSAAEQGATALNNLATVASESSGVFKDEARHKRLQRIKAMEAEAAAPIPAVLPAP